MTTNDILQLDCRSKENEQTIQRVLRLIKPLSKCSEEHVPQASIEKALHVMSRKYQCCIREMVPDPFSNKDGGTVWRATVWNDETFEVYHTVHGITVYETLAKAAIAMYAVVRKGITTRGQV